MSCRLLQSFSSRHTAPVNLNRGSSSDHGRRFRLFNGDALWRGKHCTSNQVLRRIMAGMAAKLFVMDFKVGHGAA